MRGSIRKRGNSWVAVFDLGQVLDPVTGRLKRKQKFQSFRTQRKAEAAIAAAVRDVNRGEYIAPVKTTLGAWLTEWLREMAASPKYQRATITKYTGIVKAIGQLEIAALPLQAVRVSHIEALYTLLGKTHQPGTVRAYHALLSKALKSAVRNQFVGRNVCTDVDTLPKRQSKTDGARVRTEAWTAEEARAFLAVADAVDAQTSAFYTVALDAGARLRELAGLRWSDVDLDTGTLTIAAQLAPGASLEPTWGPTKTKQARRLVLAPETILRLRKHKQTQAAIKMAHRDRYQDYGLVFAKEHGDLWGEKSALGQPLQVNNLASRGFARLIATAKVRPIKFHGLRHTVATLMMAAGERPHDVAARLGHADIHMTFNTYTHAEQDRPASAFRGVLFG